MTPEEIIEAGRYMVLATADEQGVPWASPVWYAPEDHRSFVWVSRTDTRHSRNLAVRPRLSIVIFDSTAPIGTGEGVYMDAVAEQLTEPEAAIEVFSRRSLAQGGSAWTAADVTRRPTYGSIARRRRSSGSAGATGVRRCSGAG